MDKWSRLRRTNQENEAVWNRAKQKAAPALLSEKPQTLQDTAKLCREWALKNKKDGVFNLGGKQVELVVPVFFMTFLFPNPETHLEQYLSVLVIFY